MKTKAFTLIEVLISVIILATVATILFQISIKSKNNYVFYNNKQNFENLATIALLDNINSNSNIYEQIRNQFNIKDFEFRKYLKSKKIKKDIYPYSKVSIDKDENKIFFNISQIKISTSKESTYYFSIGF